jgi:hypothetical protein
MLAPQVGLSLSGAPDSPAAPAAPAAAADAVPPMSTAELVAAWLAHPLRAANLADSATGGAGIVLDTELSRAQYGRAYVHAAGTHALSLLHRQVHLLSANSLFLGFRFFSAVLMGIVFGALYFQGDINDGLNKYGLFLNCVMQLLFVNIAEMSGAAEGKYIGYRQVANR